MVAASTSTSHWPRPLNQMSETRSPGDTMLASLFLSMARSAGRSPLMLPLTSVMATWWTGTGAGVATGAALLTGCRTR